MTATILQPPRGPARIWQPVLQTGPWGAGAPLAPWTPDDLADARHWLLPKQSVKPGFGPVSQPDYTGAQRVQLPDARAQEIVGYDRTKWPGLGIQGDGATGAVVCDGTPGSRPWVMAFDQPRTICMQLRQISNAGHILTCISGSGWELIRLASGMYFQVIETPSTNALQYYFNPFPVPDGQWMDFVLTYTGDLQEPPRAGGVLYIDGVDTAFAVTLNNLVSGSDNDQPLRIVGGNTADAQVAHVFIYDVAMTPAQVEQWRRWRTVEGLAPVFQANCEENAGPTVYDASGNANHGTISGGVTRVLEADAPWRPLVNDNGYTESGDVLVPRDESSPANDVLGDPLQYGPLTPTLAPLGDTRPVWPGMAVVGNGVDAAVDFGANQATRYNDFATAQSWSFRFKANASNLILQSQITGFSTGGWMIWYGKDGNLGNVNGALSLNLVTVWTGETLGVYAEGGTFAQGEWHHCVITKPATRNAADVRMYVDGQAANVLISHDSLASDTTEDPPQYLLSRALTNFGNADMADVAQWGAELTPAQAVDLFQSNKTDILPVWQANCEESSGLTVYDSSGNGNHGTATATMARTTSDEIGTPRVNAVGYTPGRLFGNTANLTRVTIPAMANMTATGTCAIWATPRVLDAGIMTSLRTESSGGWMLLSLSDNKVRYNIGTGATEVLGTGTEPVDVPVHMLMTWESGQMEAYRNGVLVDSVAFSGQVGEGDTAIGSTFSGSTAAFRGVLRDAQIWRQHMTAQQAQDVYNGIAVGVPIRHYALTDSGGIVVPDKGSEAQDGTAFGDAIQSANTPADESAPTLDVLGAPLTYAGPVPRDANLEGMPAFQGNGVDAYCRGTDAVYDIRARAQDFTVAMWIKALSATLATPWCVGTTAFNLAYFRLSGVNQLEFYASSNGSSWTLVVGSNLNLPVGTWHHVAFRRSGGDIFDMFLDGEKGTTRDVPDDWVIDANTLTVGARGDDIQHFTGGLSDVQFYRVAKTDGEIAAMAALRDVDDIASDYPTVHDGYDVGSNAAHLTPTPTVAQTTQDVSDYLTRYGAGSTRYFNGVGGNATAAPIGDITAAGSASIWMVPTNTATLARALMSAGPQRLFVGMGSRLLQLSIGDTNPAYTSPTQNPLNVPVHYMVTWSAGNFTVYRNGALEDTGTFTGSVGGGSAFAIGSHTSNVEWWAGVLSDARIWDVELDASQAAAVFARESVGAPIRSYPLQEVGGTTAADNGSDGADGTYNNVPHQWAPGQLAENGLAAGGLPLTHGPYANLEDGGTVDRTSAFPDEQITNLASADEPTAGTHDAEPNYAAEPVTDESLADLVTAENLAAQDESDLLTYLGH